MQTYDLSPLGALSRRGSNPNTLAYMIHHKLARRPAPLTLSVFNQLVQHANSPLYKTHCYAELTFFRSSSRSYLACRQLHVNVQYTQTAPHES